MWNVPRVKILYLLYQLPNKTTILSQVHEKLRTIHCLLLKRPMSITQKRTSVNDTGGWRNEVLFKQKIQVIFPQLHCPAWQSVASINRWSIRVWFLVRFMTAPLLRLFISVKLYYAYFMRRWWRLKGLSCQSYPRYFKGSSDFMETKEIVQTKKYQIKYSIRLYWLLEKYLSR